MDVFTITTLFYKFLYEVICLFVFPLNI